MSIRPFQQHTPTVGERAFVDRSAVVIGDVEIGADSSIWPLTVIRGDMHRIRIGRDRAWAAGYLIISVLVGLAAAAFGAWLAR